MTAGSAVTGPPLRVSARRPGSLAPSSCSSGTSDGAPLIGSTPAWFFGKAITSRRFGSRASTIVIRSIPSAIPPCGGAPIASASSRKPNFARCSSAPRPSRSKTFAWMSGSWILKQPPPSSLPFTIRSYACASASFGLLVEAVAPLVGRPRERVVHGVPARLVLVPFEHREVGHPQERERLVVDQPELASEVQAQRAEHARGLLALVGGEEQRLAVLAAERASSSSERNFAIGERTSPPSKTR